MTVGLVILLMILMGILDLGRLYFVYQALQDAAGEGALYLAIHPENSCYYTTYSGNCADPNNAQYRAAYAGDVNFARDILALSTGPDGFDASISSTTPRIATVTIHYNFQPVTPLIGAIAHYVPIRLGATASALVIES